jgi:hypothetical protein
MKIFLFRQHQRPLSRKEPQRRAISPPFSFALAMLLILLVASFSLRAGPHPGFGRLPGVGGFGDPMQNNPQSDYWREWHLMRASTDSLLQTVGTTDSEAALLLRQIQTNALFLHDKWDEWFNTHVRPKTYSPADAYLVSVRDDNRQLSKLKKEKDPAKTLDGLRDVAFDMQIKADNCRNSADGLGKEIRVKVHTKAGGKEIGGYEVFFVSKGMFEVKSAHDRFPRQSSPTDEKILCPGGYKLWVRKDKFTSEPIALGIGGHGETHLEVDIPVPAE